MKRIRLIFLFFLSLKATTFFGQIAASYGTALGSGTPGTWTETNLVNEASDVGMLSSSSALITPALNFSSASGCEATYLYFDTETFGGTSGTSANITIDISTDNGVSYTTFTVFTAPSSTLKTYGGFDISALAGAGSGSQVKIRFRTLGATGTKGVGIANIIVDEYCTSNVTIGPYAMSVYSPLEGEDCDPNCNLDAYNLYYQMCDNSTSSQTTSTVTVGENAMWASFDIPSGCTATITAEYGYPNRVLGVCSDSRMDGSDLLGIANSGVTSAQILSGTVVNVGTCNFLSATSTTASVGSNGVVSSGCVGTANTDEQVSYVATGPIYASVYGNANRSDEIIYYSLNVSSPACKTSIVTVVLPIELMSLVAYKTQEDIMIKWATATEINNNYFMVEYSLDGMNFIPYKNVKGAGNSLIKKEYSCLFTENIGNSTPYFRLKQVDFNGNFSYSPIIMLGTSLGTLITNDSKVTAYYNSEKENIMVDFNLDYPQDVIISLYDVSGSKLYETERQSYSEGKNEISISSPDKTGIYILVYQNGNSAPIHKKIIVIK